MMRTLLGYLILAQLSKAVLLNPTPLSCIQRTSLSHECTLLLVQLLQQTQCSSRAPAAEQPPFLPMVNRSQLQGIDYMALYEIPGVPLLIRNIGLHSTEDPASFLEMYKSLLGLMGVMESFEYVHVELGPASVRCFGESLDNRKRLLYIGKGAVQAFVSDKNAAKAVSSTTKLFSQAARSSGLLSGKSFFFNMYEGSLLSLPGDFDVCWKTIGETSILDASYISVRDLYETDSQQNGFVGAEGIEQTETPNSLRALQLQLRTRSLVRQTACSELKMHIERVTRTRAALVCENITEDARVEIQYTDVNTSVTTCLSSAIVPDGNFVLDGLYPSSLHVVRARFLSPQWGIKCSWSSLKRFRTTAKSLPQAPRDAVVKLVGEQHVVEWVCPEDDGGHLVDHYVIVRSESASGPFELAQLHKGNLSLSTPLANVRPGVEHFVKIAAATAAGVGEFTAPLRAPLISKRATIPIGGALSPYHHLSNISSEDYPKSLGPEVLRRFLSGTRERKAFGLLSDTNQSIQVGEEVIEGWSGQFSPKLYDVHAPLHFESNGGCRELEESSIRGWIVVVERGGCPLYTKASHAAAAGAVGLVIVDQDNSEFCMLGSSKRHGDGFASTDNGALWRKLHLPALMIEGRDLELLKSSLRI